jgi:hypothetical protein
VIALLLGVADSGSYYGIDLMDSSVQVCPFPDSGCVGTLLRQNVATGEVVEIGFCVRNCYVDECVAPGTYRYGFAQPFVCGPNGAQYYIEGTVTSALDANCARAPGDAGPTASSNPVPWKDSPVICLSNLDPGCR